MRPAALLAGLTFAALATTSLAASKIQQGTLIELADGAVQGEVDGATRRFLGIPFAAPPVGALRWRPPAPAMPVGGRPRGGRIRPAVPAARRLSSDAERERGLPLPERLDAGSGAARRRCR